MIKKKKVTKDNVVKFPTKLSDIDKQIEAVIFAGSLELVKEGNLSIKQDKLFDDIYIKEIND